MKLKKSLATFLTAALTITSVFPVCNVFAETDTPEIKDVAEPKDVYVTITNAGEICYDKDQNPVIVRKINVSDKNSNGSIDIDDAFITIHEEAGFSDGYATSEADWGLSISKLWGVENGGAYGYYVNNEIANGLMQTLENNDYLSAYVYKDASSYSDVYTYFNKETVDLKYDNTTLDFELSAYTFDPVNYTPVILPVTDATITTLEDESITAKPDENGKVSLTFEAGKTYTVVARNDEKNYVPAFCKVTVEAKPEEEKKDDSKKDDKKDSTTENKDNKDSKKTDTAKNDTTKNNDATVATAKVGDTFSDKNLTYKITKAASTDGKVAGEVEVSALKNKKTKKITINATIKFNGVTYKVTSIGKKAFAKAKKLKKIIIKSTTIKKVGKSALKKTSKKLVIKVPKKQKKAYKKLFKKAGNKKVKVK